MAFKCVSYLGIWGEAVREILLHLTFSVCRCWVLETKLSMEMGVFLHVASFVRHCWVFEEHLTHGLLCPAQGFNHFLTLMLAVSWGRLWWRGIKCRPYPGTFSSSGSFGCSTSATTSCTRCFGRIIPRTFPRWGGGCHGDCILTCLFDVVFIFLCLLKPLSPL